jgi:conserved hypothetical protein
MTTFEWKSWKIVGILLSIALLVLAFRKVDFDQLLAVLSGAKLLPLLIVVLIDFVVTAINSYRWQMIINATKSVAFLPVFLTTLVGYMANTFLPARSGDLVRIIILGRKEGISKTTVLGTLAIDRIFEGVGMLPILLVLPFLGRTPDWLRTITLVLIAFLVVLLGLLIILLRAESETWINRGEVKPTWRTRLANLIIKLREGLKPLNRIGLMFKVVGISVISWVIQAFMVHLCLVAIDLHIGFQYSIFVLMVINLAMLIPSAPANLGTFEYSAILALGYLGVDATPALSFALLYHFAQLIPTTVAGILAIPALGMRFRDIS